MSTIFWIVIGLVILVACANGSKGKTTCSRGKPIRIDHPYYFDEDDHECSVCGARFRRKGMSCPKCGVSFTGKTEDNCEFIEEMVIWDDDD